MAWALQPPAIIKLNAIFELLAVIFNYAVCNITWRWTISLWRTSTCSRHQFKATTEIVVNVCTRSYRQLGCPPSVIGRFSLLLHASGTVCHFTSLQHHLYRLSAKKRLKPFSLSRSFLSEFVVPYNSCRLCSRLSSLLAYSLTTVTNYNCGPWSLFYKTWSIGCCLCI